MELALGLIGRASPDSRGGEVFGRVNQNKGAIIQKRKDGFQGALARGGLWCLARGGSWFWPAPVWDSFLAHSDCTGREGHPTAHKRFSPTNGLGL